MRYRDEKFYWTYQRGVGWPDDYIGPDSMTRWIIEKSVGFTDVGLHKISESVRAYAYLILSSQASARSGIVGNTASALTAQSAFLNNFENVVNRRVDIREDIKRCQDTLSYASSKVDYSVGQNIYMLPSDMNLKIKTGTVVYNNKILVSDEKFSLGKNVEVNSLELAKVIALEPSIKSYKVVAKPLPGGVQGSGGPRLQVTQRQLKQRNQLLMKMKKLLWYWLWQVVLQYGIFFDETRNWKPRFSFPC